MKTDLMYKGEEFLSEYLKLCEKYQLMLRSDTLNSHLWVSPKDETLLEEEKTWLKNSVKWWAKENE